MKIFDQLAQGVAAEWQNKNQDLESFAAVATQALERFNYDWSLEELERELEVWALTQKTLPNQISVHNTFGQPSITLFNDGRFVVDLYFWVDFDTSIHSHGFRGAFKVLHGESLQEVFSTSIKEKVAEDLLIVDMSEVEVEKIKEGAVRRIAPGSDLTHRVIHLANPTVSLCVKTINEPHLKQWTYLPSGLAVQKSHPSADLIKKIYFYQYLTVRGESPSGPSGRARDFLLALLDDLKLSEQIHLYEDVASRSLDLKDEVVEAITQEILERHEDQPWWALYEEAYLNQESPEAIRERALAAVTG